MKPDETPPEAVTEGEQEDEEGEAPLGAGIDFTDPNSPLAPYYLRASHLVALLLLALVFGLYSFFPLWHTDVWGHLKFGQWIVEHRALPAHALSPFADKQAPYINFQWLSQVGIYLLYRGGEVLAGGDALRRTAGGAEMLQAAQVVLAMSCYVLLLLAYRRRARSLPLACAGLVVLLALTPTALVIARPQIAGVVLFAGLLLALSRPVLSRRALFVVPILMVAWANLHGSYAVGLVLLGCFWVGRVLDVAGKEGTWSLFRVWNDAQAQRLLVVLVASVLAIACLNPHGPYLYLYTLRFGEQPNIRTLDEWGPLDFTLRPGGMQWRYLAALILLVVTQLASPQGLMPSQLAVLLTFGAWPLFQERMLLWWFPLVPWLVLPLWADLGQRLSWSWLHYQSVPSFRKTLLAGFIVVVFLSLFAPVRWLIRRGPRPLDSVVSQGAPWRVTAELQAEGDERGQWLPALRQELDRFYPGGEFTGRIFASETQADYLLWALPSEWPLLVYSHVHLFPPDHWRECLTVKFANAGWWEVLDRHRVNLVVVEPLYNAALVSVLRKAPEWQVVLDEEEDSSKRDPRTRVFIALRKNPRAFIALRKKPR